MTHLHPPPSFDTYIRAALQDLVDFPLSTVQENAVEHPTHQSDAIAAMASVLALRAAADPVAVGDVLAAFRNFLRAWRYGRPSDLSLPGGVTLTQHGVVLSLTVVGPVDVIASVWQSHADTVAFARRLDTLWRAVVASRSPGDLVALRRERDHARRTIRAALPPGVSRGA